MVHPGPQGVHGARISATTVDGRTVELFNEPSDQGLMKMINAATKKKKEGGVHELRWTSGPATVALELKIVSNPNETAAPQGQGFRGLRLPATIVGRDMPASANAVAMSGGAQ
jgi:type VI secretion system protein ImpL